MSVRFILFPGRHHLVTRFQASHLARLVAEHPGSVVVWAITSANHAGTQRNPIPGARRLGLIEAVAARESLPSLTFLIANRQPKADFAHYVIEEIRTQSGGRIAMTPANTLVACSTPAVIADYSRLGFPIDPMELGARRRSGASGADVVVVDNHDDDATRPWDVVERLITTSLDDPAVIAEIHPVALAHYRRYGLADAIHQVYADPLIDSADGDITVTRDYASYRAAFEDNAWRKVGEFAHLVRPGRIVDVGCATGQTIKLLSERPELFESDFYGVEVARPLVEICEQRLANGEFGDANVYIHQRNIMQTQLFEPRSLDTVITMALTHEIESYLGRQALVEFCARVHAMLRPGGVWINYDVVGPDGGDELVLAAFPTGDGEAIGQLAGLSTRARFERFAHDFRREEGDQIAWRVVRGDDDAGAGAGDLIELRRADLYDFLAKKDYVDSWLSEAHERFCFFSPADWAELLEETGFVMREVRAIRNPWLIANRFAPGARVFRRAAGGRLVGDEWSWTNVMLVAEVPAR